MGDRLSKASTSNEQVKDLVAEYGQGIVNECHNISAFTFEQVIRQVKAKYVVGLTATPTHKDGHAPIIYMQCGPVRVSMSARTMKESMPFEHRVIPRLTSDGALLLHSGSSPSAPHLEGPPMHSPATNTSRASR